VIGYQKGIDMDLGLKGKRALVTGAGRGIGRSTALSLAAEGARVAVVARTSSDIQTLVREMGGEMKGHCGFSMDLIKDGAPAKMLQRLKKCGFGPLEIVVHNLGGVLDLRDPFCSVKDWRRVFRINFEVAVELNLQVLPAMQKRKWGRLVHVSSIAAVENQGPVPYCAAKAALAAYVRSMGGIVAPDGVVMSAVLPGGVFTKGGDWDMMQRTRPEHVKKYLKERQRIGRFGRPEEIADFITYLCSDLASFNTGSIVPIDGGQGRGYFGQ
jgi:NAD(P)-dependent dehydrogenase (short-subunit alcohol dehydrogenase family)